MFSVGELVKFDAIRGPDDARCKWRATNVIALDGSGRENIYFIVIIRRSYLTEVDHIFATWFFFFYKFSKKLANRALIDGPLNSYI